MIKLVKVGEQYNTTVSEYYGLDKDSEHLPVNSADNDTYISTSSTFFCIDTGVVWMFEEESNKWHRL